MELWQVLYYIIIPLIIAYAGLNERDKSIMKDKLSNTLNKDEVEHLIELKNKPMEVLQIEAAKDIKQCNDKLDKIEGLIRHINDNRN